MSMKSSFFLISAFFLCIFSHPVWSQSKITIDMGKFKCYDKPNEALRKSETIEAFQLMSTIFSSKEFQDSLANLEFPMSTLCTDCGTGMGAGKTKITGKDIMAMLFRRNADILDLVLKEKSSALGETYMCSALTTAYYKNIEKDMCHLPAATRLAVNLCHEYMHRLGFCHHYELDETTLRLIVQGDSCRTEYFDPKAYNRDLAYRVGWIAYDIVKRPYAKK
ncbi:hypothetical protein [Mucilaginibacter sp.]|uniref:hypothetical protein n=1 Tax=Mucilaginibacter sp. TaxID=1882438 RepID=UPI003D142A36